VAGNDGSSMLIAALESPIQRATENPLVRTLSEWHWRSSFAASLYRRRGPCRKKQNEKLPQRRLNSGWRRIGLPARQQKPVQSM